MIDCVSVRNMRFSDQQTIVKGMSGRELIRRAARGIYDTIEWSGKIAILCGSGNNGADGYALSILLKENGYDVSVYTVTKRMHEDCFYFAEEAKRKGLIIQNYENDRNSLTEYDMIVDCLLGTGFTGELRENYRQAIEEINRTSSYVVSVDINSGMNGDSGKGDFIVKSDLTVTIEFVKNGMAEPSAEEYIGRLVCVKIGIELSEQEDKLCNEQEWEELCERLSVGNGEQEMVYDGVRYIKCPRWICI